MKMRTWILRVLLIGSFCFGIIYLAYNWLYPTGSRFGPAFNAERQRLGIAIIPENWTADNKYSSTTMWRPQRMDTLGAFRSSKIVVTEDGRVKEEVDTYLYKGNSRYEKLTITYNYLNIDKWGYSYYNSNLDNYEHVLSKEKADSVLKSWNLKYK